MDLSNSSPNKDEFNVDLKSLEVPLEKLPMAESKNLFENFLLIGYDDLYFQEIISKEALNIKNSQKENNKISSKDKKNSEKSIKFCCRNLPIILNSITSDFDGPILNGDLIIKNVFPIPPEIFIEIEGKDFSPDKKNYFLIFSNIQNNVVNFGFAYIFYAKNVFNEIKIHVPKAFVIISQYPFFRIFYNLCEEILELFNKNKQLQIPIEIQIYNIINFTPAPIDMGLKMTLIPKQDLNRIITYKNQDDFFNSDEQQKYYAAQLNGYRTTEINFCVLLSILPINAIVETYLHLISGSIIGVFHNNICELSLILHIFHQFLFPFAPNENVSCLSPIKFFCNETVDQNLVGFLCNYEELEMYNPLRALKEGEFRFLTEEEENIQPEILYFGCDFILDIDKKQLKEPDKYNTRDKNTRDNNKKLNKLITNLVKNQKPSTELESIVLNLVKGLDENIQKLTHSKIKLEKKVINFINENAPNLNKTITKLFYQFNLDLSNLYYKRISRNKGDFSKTKDENLKLEIEAEKDSDLNEHEYFFFSRFANSLICNCLENFVGGYSDNEPKIYKAPKLIFENLLYFLKIKLDYKLKDKNIQDILEIYDEIYTNKVKNIDDEKKNNKDFNKKDKKDKKDKKEKNSKEETMKFMEFYDKEKMKENSLINRNANTFSFFEFYKYYISSPEIPLYFYKISNPKIISGNMEKTPLRIKYIFNYNKVALDQNIIFKYIYKLKQMDEATKNKCFKNIIENQIEPKEKIRSYENFISSALEKYYIEKKYVDNFELLNLSILGCAILSIAKSNLIDYSKEINHIIKNLTFSTRKFAKIFLSVSLRKFCREEDKNFFIYEKYFDIYRTAIENKNIIPDDELIIIRRKIEEFKKKFSEFRLELKISNTKKIYELKYNENIVKKINVFELNHEIQSKGQIIISFKFAKINFKSPTIYHIPKLYEEIYNLIDAYYKDLDYNIIQDRKDEFNKLIIYLLFYITIDKEKDKRKEKKDKKQNNKEEIKISFPENIESFLIDCLV